MYNAKYYVRVVGLLLLFFILNFFRIIPIRIGLLLNNTSAVLIFTVCANDM